MLTKFNDSNDMNTAASDVIHSYIKEGYRIDAKESAINRDKDKDCTFKAVLKKDEDGVECKVVIKVTDSVGDKRCTFYKLETANGIKRSEETRSYYNDSTLTNMSFTKLSDVIKTHNDSTKCTPTFSHLDDYITLHDLHDKNIKIAPAKDNHIKVSKDDSVDDLYSKITSSKSLDKASETKLRKDTSDSSNTLEDAFLYWLSSYFVNRDLL